VLQGRRSRQDCALQVHEPQQERDQLQVHQPAGRPLVLVRFLVLARLLPRTDLVLAVSTKRLAPVLSCMTSHALDVGYLLVLARHSSSCIRCISRPSPYHLSSVISPLSPFAACSPAGILSFLPDLGARDSSPLFFVGLWPPHLVFGRT